MAVLPRPVVAVLPRPVVAVLPRPVVAVLPRPVVAVLTGGGGTEPAGRGMLTLAGRGRHRVSMQCRGNFRGQASACGQNNAAGACMLPSVHTQRGVGHV
jgi:hypothetical protein